MAGKVARDGSQTSFGTLTLDHPRNRLLVDIKPPGGPRLQQAHALKSRPFILYDFDFADLNAVLQADRPSARFAYDLPVIWPAADGLFRDYGRLVGTFAAFETHLGRRTLRFNLRVEGGSKARGTLWLDRAGGFIVDAVLPLPNHDNYRDFRLQLVDVDHGGPTAWAALLAGHYANCPTGN